MSTKVNFDHNIEDVISDVDDVKDDLRHEVNKRVGLAVRSVWARAKQYVLDDPHTTGDLFSALQYDDTVLPGSETLRFRVFTDAGIAPYAAVTEYGSGQRREVSGDTARPFPAFRADERKPPRYPFEAPSIGNLDGFAYYIEQWMTTKGVEPEEYPTVGLAARAIAKTIAEKGTYAHPYLRPAWFEKELQVKKAARNAVKNATR